MNKVILMGNLTKDPEVRYTQNGKAYARTGIAVNRPFTKDKEAVDFFNLVAWEKRAETMGNYLRKGSRILIEGRMQTNSYEKDGVKHSGIDIIIDNFWFAGGSRDDKREDKPKGDYYTPPPDMGHDPNDTPF